MNSSAHLDRLIDNNYGNTNIQVVFVDIEKYSERKSYMQRKVIDLFTNLLNEAFNEVGRKYLTYTQQDGLNLSKDIIRIPTGDGLAAVFSFGGLKEIHVDFGRELLKYIDGNNKSNPCEIFDTNHWCNCHTNFRVRIGISEGRRSIIYKDTNGNYNVAGYTMNIAARVMSLADGMQILLDGDGYKTMIDMTETSDLEKKFRKFEGVLIKHGWRIDVYQYCPDDAQFINQDIPKNLSAREKAERVKSIMPEIAKLMFNPSTERAEDMEEMQDASMEMLMKMLEIAKRSN